MGDLDTPSFCMLLVSLSLFGIGEGWLGVLRMYNGMVVMSSFLMCS